MGPTKYLGLGPLKALIRPCATARVMLLCVYVVISTVKMNSLLFTKFCYLILYQNDSVSQITVITKWEHESFYANVLQKSVDLQFMFFC